MTGKTSRAILEIIVAVIICGIAIFFVTGYRINKVNGNSMEPTIVDGSICISIESTVESIRATDIIVYKDGGRTVINRVQATLDDMQGNRTIYVKGDNKKNIEKIAIDNECIRSKVLWVIDKEGFRRAE